MAGNTPNGTTDDRLGAAAQRALESLDDLIANTTDPGVEALGARYELAHALSTAGPTTPRRQRLDIESDEQRTDRLETAKKHAAGMHEHCGVECETEFPSDMLRNGILARAVPGSATMLDELLRRAAQTPAGTPAMPAGVAPGDVFTEAAISHARTEAARLRDQLDELAEGEPIQLRWGLDDVMWGDDDTTTVMLSGPAGEPYWLDLDAGRTAALRGRLAGPTADERQPETGTTADKAAAAGMTPEEYRAESHRAAAERVRTAAGGLYVEAGVRVLAALNGNPTVLEAHPPLTEYVTELLELDGIWMDLGGGTERSAAEKRRAGVIRRYPETETRIVRRTTTYTVEPDVAPAEEPTS